MPLPLPRQRLYSTLGTYVRPLVDSLSGRVHAGNDVAALEERLRERTGAKFVLCTNRARVGLYLGVKAALSRTPSRRKVVMSPYTVFDVVNMVISAGGIPVFADIERATCNIDTSQIRELVDGETGAVLVTHLHGLACDMDAITSICRSSGVALIEDAAQAVGARHAGRMVGTFGDVGVYSFGMMKNVNSLHGGALLTDDEDIAQQVRDRLAEFEGVAASDLLKRAAYGLALDVATHPLVFRAATYWVFRYAFLHDIAWLNTLSRSEINPQLRRDFPATYRRRFSQTQARLVLRQLASIDRLAEARIRTARLYFDLLEDVPEIILPPWREDGSHAYLVYPIQVPNRRALLRHLFLSHRDCAAQHMRNCADFSVFCDYHRDCPNARLAERTNLLLPTYPGYGLKEAERTAMAVRSYFGPQPPGSVHRSANCSVNRFQ